MFSFFRKPLLVLFSSFFIIFVLSTFSCSRNSVFLRGNFGVPLYQCSIPQIVVVASDVPTEDLIEIESAMHYWNSVLNATVFLFSGRIDETSTEISKPNYIVVALYPEKDIKRAEVRGVADSNLSSKGCIRGTVIRYANQRIGRDSPIFLRAILAHEFGHALGLEHSRYINNLMYPSIFRSIKDVPRIDEKQIKALKDMYGLK